MFDLMSSPVSALVNSPDRLRRWSESRFDFMRTREPIRLEQEAQKAWTGQTKEARVSHDQCQYPFFRSNCRGRGRAPLPSDRNRMLMLTICLEFSARVCMGGQTVLFLIHDPSRQLCDSVCKCSEMGQLNLGSCAFTVTMSVR